MLPVLFALLAGQNATTTCQRLYNQVVCNTQQQQTPQRRAPDLDAYSRALGVDNQPTYQEQEIQRQQLRALQLRNEAMRRDLDARNPPSPSRLLATGVTLRPLGLIRDPIGREAYVGCYLLLQGKDVPLNNGAPVPDYYSAQAYKMIVGVLAGLQDSKPPAQRAFCLPSMIAANPEREMAAAYIDLYERGGRGLAEMSAVNIAFAAFHEKWPCPS